MKPFPIPVRSIGPGSQDEDETLDYMEMPKGMTTFHSPILPEPEAVANLQAAKAALVATRDALYRLTQGDLSEHGRTGTTLLVSLDTLDEANRRLINQVLGEGEVSAQIQPSQGHHGVQVQESVYAGVWRVLITTTDGALHDHIEVGLVPQVLLDASVAAGSTRAALSAEGQLPPGVMNAPAILSELDEQLRTWRVGQAAHVINLTLLPLSPEDVAYLGQRLGVGDVTVLSRGYGNCRVTSTTVPHCWQVVYYNSQDHIILNTIEVTRIPDVVNAATEDLVDSLERVSEAVVWLEAGP